MTRKKHFGTCHLCGSEAKLSFEHVPPEKAFNDRALTNIDVQKLLHSEDIKKLDDTSGIISQRGAGGYTLCIPCNTKTGGWYGGAYVDWVYQGMEIITAINDRPKLTYPFQIYPLRVIKQIICMFFSANPPEFQSKNVSLSRFVLNKEMRVLDPKYKVYAFYALSNRSRQSAISGLFSLDHLGANIFSEIAFPPFGYVLSIDSPPPDKRLVDITHFSEFEYDEKREIFMKLDLLPIYTYFPGDYRSRQQVHGEAS